MSSKLLSIILAFALPFGISGNALIQNTASETASEIEILNSTPNESTAATVDSSEGDNLANDEIEIENNNQPDSQNPETSEDSKAEDNFLLEDPDIKSDSSLNLDLKSEDLEIESQNTNLTELEVENSNTAIESVGSDDFEGDYIAMVTKALEEFYEDYYLIKNYDINKYLTSGNIKTFIKNKLEQRHYLLKTNWLVTEYKCELEFISERKVGSIILLEVASRVEYKLECDSPSGRGSGHGELAELVLIPTENGYKIQDWYVKSNSYDYFFRICSDDPRLLQHYKDPPNLQLSDASEYYLSNEFNIDNINIEVLEAKHKEFLEALGQNYKVINEEKNKLEKI